MSLPMNLLRKQAWFLVPFGYTGVTDGPLWVGTREAESNPTISLVLNILYGELTPIRAQKELAMM